MVDAIVSLVLEQLVSVAVEEANQQVRLRLVFGGVDQQVEKLKSNLRAIQAVVVDAEQRQYKEKTLGLWLDELKHASYDIEDVLEEWFIVRLKSQIQVRKKVCSFFPAATSCFGCKQVFLRRNISLKIKSISQKLDDITRRKDMFNLSVIRSSEKPEWIPTTSIIDVSEVRGRNEEKETLKSKLLCESSEEKNAVQIISIVGMGGNGKTTLAQFAYNDYDVISNFEKKIWVCVSGPFDQFRIVKAILEALEGSIPSLGELESLLLRLRTSIAGKKFFLVLDDVWTEDRNQWEPLRNCLINGGHGSKILVTTRKESVAQMIESMNVVSIKELSEQESWSLFKRFAFFGRSIEDCEQLEDIGRKIIVKCKGLPLVVKTMGSMLRFKRSREEWQNILDSELWQLEEFEKGILPSLLLSYNDLPSKIKQCFSYCAVFPKGYDIKKDELILLWMAQGYIRQEGNKEMEIVGEEYFSYLASKYFFQEFRKDDEGTIISCKMHDIIHDFARFLIKNECLDVNSNYFEMSCFNQKLRHLMLVLTDWDKFSFPIIKAKKLRSLLIDSQSKIPLEIFRQLKSLRTLKIVDERLSICKIPKEIKELTLLRYLKLEGLGIEKLPNSCCKLFNLQILEMRRCFELRELPQGIGKLVNLRHLIFDVLYLDYMPKGIEKLTCLRVLSGFAGKSSRVDDSKTCKLEGLRHLNHLRGSIRIQLYGNVRNIDEAKNVNLDKKKNLLDLALNFHMDLDENEADYEAICEALRPPENLESLKIERYASKTLWPTWIVSLHKLKKLSLSTCLECKILPPLGKLPSLEKLRVWDFKSVERVGNEFLGIEEKNDVHGTSSYVIAFPKLKQLTLQLFYFWEEWEFGNEDIEIMPQLNYLSIEQCENLTSLPNQLLRSTTLKTLQIYSCPVLRERFKKDTGEDWSNISHIPNIRIDRDYVQGCEQQQQN